MAVFTRTWDATYMANPADSQSASQGAARIREVRIDVKERLEVDHSWAGDVDDGLHKRLTLVDPLAAKPTQVNDEVYVYSKDVSGTAELFFEDEAGNEVQLSNAGSFFPVGAIYISTSSANPSSFFGGTWTQISKGRTLLGEGTGGGSSYTGGASAGSKDAVNITHSHSPGTLSVDADGIHTHTANRGSGSSSSSTTYAPGGSTPNTQSGLIDNSTAHTHTLSGATSIDGVSGTDLNMMPYLVVYIWERTA